MCGLVTFFAAGGNVIDSSLVREMTESIRHRGPDDLGYLGIDPVSGEFEAWSADFPKCKSLSGVVFGFRRLSILDPTKTGHQPMLSDDRSMVLTFNGEIYNFIELREELMAAGVKFRSRTDTEVLLKTYERWGDSCFGKFNGMWAVTLWDGRRRRLVVSRDRFGVKPLYYVVVDGTWIFASEIKAILRHPGVERRINDRTLFEYLAYGRIDHSTETAFAGIRSLAPGSVMQITSEGATERRFWQLDVTGTDGPRLPEKHWTEEFTRLFTDAVRIRMRSDVPIGTMLSGGLDSTSIAGVINARLRKAELDPTERTGLEAFHHAFSACWPAWSDNEEAEIDAICAGFGLTAHKLYPDENRLLDLLHDVVIALDEPFMTPICLVNYQLMQSARGHGVKVVLNGHGSDESLAGYGDMFVPAFLADLARRGRLLRFTSEYRAFKDQADYSVSSLARLFLKSLVPPGALSLLRGLRGASDSEKDVFSPAMAVTYPDREPFRLHYQASSIGSLRRLLVQKFLYEFVPQWLRMEDRMSMAWSIESRLPFMDYRLVQLAFDMPDDMKLRNGWTKYVLRRAMKDILPDRTVSHRTKRKFAAPHTDWFRASWRSAVEELLLSRSPRIAPYLDLPVFRRRLTAWMNGDDAALRANAVWRAVNAELWVQAVGWNRP